MLEFFQDEKGEHRYRIKGGNGEPMVTSEGYDSASNAKRGYWDLVYLIVDAHAGKGPDRDEAKAHRESVIKSNTGADAESIPETDASEAQEESQGAEEAEGSSGSRHDECPDDNPAALRQDD